MGVSTWLSQTGQYRWQWPFSDPLATWESSTDPWESSTDPWESSTDQASVYLKFKEILQSNLPLWKVMSKMRHIRIPIHSLDIQSYLVRIGVWTPTHLLRRLLGIISWEGFSSRRHCFHETAKRWYVLLFCLMLWAMYFMMVYVHIMMYDHNVF